MCRRRKIFAWLILKHFDTTRIDGVDASWRHRCNNKVKSTEYSHTKPFPDQTLSYPGV
jgi:hypothetical protein